MVQARRPAVCEKAKIFRWERTLCIANITATIFGGFFHYRGIAGVKETEAYVCVDHKRLRRGYTTGSCAAAAAGAAAQILLGGAAIDSIHLDTPKGIGLDLQVQQVEMGDGWCRCAVQKDSGDDPDSTHGVLVYAKVWLEPQYTGKFTLEGGIGVGRVTKPGLECPVGAPAINRVPREMIEAQVRKACDQYGYDGGIGVEISVPAGVELAKKTYNPRLGIEGGISILGTSGIVEPMSEKALTDTIRLELQVLRKSGVDSCIITPGNYGETFLRQTLPVDLSRAVKCSNYIGETLDFAVELGFRRLLLVGHLGKFIKLAGGVMNTHSRYADCRMEIATAYAALCGADHQTLCRLMECVTTDDVIEILTQQNLVRPFMDLLIKRICYHVEARTAGEVDFAVVVFSNRYGMLGQTKNLAEIQDTLI